MIRVALYACVVGAALFAGREALKLVAEVDALTSAAASPLEARSVRALLEARRYRELGDLLAGYRAQLASGGGSDLALLQVAAVFRHADPKLDEALRRWVAASPDSCDAQVALGVSLAHRIRLGWEGAPGEDLPDELASLRREALTAFAGASDADPRCVFAYALAAELSGADGDALGRLERGLAQNPGSVLLRSLIWSVRAHASHTDPAEVDRSVEEARGAVSQQALEDLRREAQVIKAELLTRDQHILAAAQLYPAALEQSSDPAHLMARARFYDWLGWQDDARRDYERVLAIQSDHSDAHLTLATMAFDRGDEGEAREHIQEVLAIEPRHPGALTLQARLLQQQGDFEAAAQALGQALELGSRRADVLAEFGSLNLRLKQFERALEYLSSAVTAAPGNGRYAADHALALCLMQSCVRAADLSQLSDSAVWVPPAAQRSQNGSATSWRCSAKTRRRRMASCACWSTTSRLRKVDPAALCLPELGSRGCSDGRSGGKAVRSSTTT